MAQPPRPTCPIRGRISTYLTILRLSRHQLLDLHLDPCHATLLREGGKEHEPEPKARVGKKK